MQQVKSILDKNEKDIITACQNYLYECEQGKKKPMTPDIGNALPRCFYVLWKVRPSDWAKGLWIKLCLLFLLNETNENDDT